jgi:hypothetical protein
VGAINLDGAIQKFGMKTEKKKGEEDAGQWTEHTLQGPDQMRLYS